MCNLLLWEQGIVPYRIVSHKLHGPQVVVHSGVQRAAVSIRKVLRSRRVSCHTRDKISRRQRNGCHSCDRNGRVSETQ